MVAPLDAVYYYYGDLVSLTQKEGLAFIDESGVRAGQHYVHWRRGSRYTVLSVGLNEATLEPMVGYAGADGVVWYRPLRVWCEYVAPGRQRFALIGDDETPATAPPPAHSMMPQPRGGRFL